VTVQICPSTVLVSFEPFTLVSVEDPFFEPYILGPTNTALQHIELRCAVSEVKESLQLFGDPANLLALRTLQLQLETVSADDARSIADWRDLDALLAKAANSLKYVQIYSGGFSLFQKPPDLELARSLLPSIADKLSVHPSSEWAQFDY
jgi:hypothetical protein